MSRPLMRRDADVGAESLRRLAPSKLFAHGHDIDGLSSHATLKVRMPHGHFIYLMMSARDSYAQLIHALRSASPR